MKMSDLKVGATVVYVDPVGKHHEALVTAVWGQPYDTELWSQEEAEAWVSSIEYYNDRPEDYLTYINHLVGTPHTVPSVNVVYVVGEEDKTDSYGRQIARDTSVVFKGQQAAHGRYYYFK